MANKREFKKYVEAVGASACDEMMSAYYTVDGIDKDSVSKAVEQVLCAVAAARANANVFFDKGSKAFSSRKEYSKAKQDFFEKLFEKINGDFSKQLDEALKVFNSAVPREVKEQNKELASAE